MVQKMTVGEKVFAVANYALMLGLAFVCILPLIHVLAVSMSSSAAASSGIVRLWPVDFTVSSYNFIVKKPAFLTSLGITLQRVLLGTVVNMVLTVLTAYPLSKEMKHFRMRTVYTWFFFFTALFGGGLIPWYMTIKATGLLNSIFALVIPGAVPIFHVILMLNFFRSLPKELEESAFIDGAGHVRVLWSIYLPLSPAAIATITLFTVVGHWNAWFDGLILMNSPARYPLQSYLQIIVIAQNLFNSIHSSEEWKILAQVSDRTAKAAQIFLGALPILLLYPFLQKYFMKGIVLGSVKG
jgi:putative aldouronate transport system permease protein